MQTSKRESGKRVRAREREQERERESKSEREGKDREREKRERVYGGERNIGRRGGEEGGGTSLVMSAQ